MTNNIEIESKEKKKPKNLQVIAFKLVDSQIKEIKKSINNQMSASLSEYCRIAIFDLLQAIIDEKVTDMMLSDLLKNAMEGNKSSACAKIPENFLKIVDKFVKEKNIIFQNRTNLIRIAIQFAIENERNMLEYYKETFEIDVE